MSDRAFRESVPEREQYRNKGDLKEPREREDGPRERLKGNQEESSRTSQDLVQDLVGEDHSLEEMRDQREGIHASSQEKGRSWNMISKSNNR
jgi:hypothetical protein